MLNNIPQNRLILYIMLAGLLPIIFAWLTFSSQKESVNELENAILRVQEQAYSREKKQSLNMTVRNHYRDADHFYIDKNLETLSFLEPEVESLKNIQTNPNFLDDEIVKKRYEALTSENRLSFTEGVVQSTPIYQEVTESLVHPVEINTKDLREILCRTEGVAIGQCVPPSSRPQLVILEFKLDKKSIWEKSEIFQLNMKLLKREFL